METVNRAQLAKHLNTSPANITKLAKKGIFDDCFNNTGTKLYLEKAVKAYNMRVNKRRKRGVNSQNSDEKPKNIDENTVVYNADNQKELAKLLRDLDNPLEKARLETTFWQAKTRRLTFLETEGDLIPLNEAKKAIDAVLTPFNKDLDDLPIQMKGHNPEVSDEVVTWLMGAINDIKTKSAQMWDTLDSDD